MKEEKEMMKDEAKDEGMMGLEKPAKKKAKKPAAPKAEKSEKKESKESKSEKPKAKKAKSGHKVHEMRIRKAGDGYVVENHHAPDEMGMTPPMEEFAHPHLDAVHAHMDEHMGQEGDQNPEAGPMNAAADKGDAGMEPAGPAQVQMA